MNVERYSLAFSTIPSQLGIDWNERTIILSNDAVRNQSVDETFWQVNLRSKSMKMRLLVQYYFLEQGLSTSTSHSPGLMYVRKLMNRFMLYSLCIDFFERI